MQNHQRRSSPPPQQHHNPQPKSRPRPGDAPSPCSPDQRLLLAPTPSDHQPRTTRTPYEWCRTMQFQLPSVLAPSRLRVDGTRTTLPSDSFTGDHSAIVIGLPTWAPKAPGLSAQQLQVQPTLLIVLRIKPQQQTVTTTANPNMAINKASSPHIKVLIPSWGGRKGAPNNLEPKWIRKFGDGDNK